MSFRDLPQDVRDHPLTDPTVQADVVDLIVSQADRRAGSMAMMLCDAQCRPFQPIVIGAVPEQESTACLAKLLDLVVPVLAEDGGSVLVARGRQGSTAPTDGDRALHQAAIDRCSEHRVRLLGCFVATPGGVTSLPEPLTVAS
jgi:hypothetical protein